MTVNPGFGGQGFIEPVLEKVREVAAFREDRKLEFNIEVDGGVSDKTAAACVAAGANVLVAGTALFRAPDMSQAMARMRRACGARG
jgi:ribulose-phosphate 3-epimerase